MMAVRWMNFVDAHALGDAELAQLVFDELPADSDGDRSVVDSEYVDEETDGEVSIEEEEEAVN